MTFIKPLTEDSVDESETLEPIKSPIQEPPKMDDLKKAQETHESPQGSISNSETQEKEDEEEGECGFCLFMKGGGCKDKFVDWEKCVEDAENNKQDVVEKCFQVTDSLRKCMAVHSDYYEPILSIEKAAEAEAIRELEKEEAANSNQESDKDKVDTNAITNQESDKDKVEEKA